MADLTVASMAGLRVDLRVVWKAENLADCSADQMDVPMAAHSAWMMAGLMADHLADHSAGPMDTTLADMMAASSAASTVVRMVVW